MKLLVVSDLHADWFTAGFDRYEDVAEAVAETTTAAIREKVDGYLFLGDLCDPDTARSHRASALAVKTYMLLKDNGIESFWLAGNHDVIEDGTGATTLSALKAAGANVFEQPGSAVFRGLLPIIALPYTARSHAYDPAQFIERVAGGVGKQQRVLIVGHLNLEGIGPGSETTDMPRGRDVFWPTAAIREFFPNAVVLGGHIHKRQVFNGVQIVGSLIRCTFGEEENEPGYLIIEI